MFTLAQALTVTSEIEVRRSRFIATITRASSEGQARAFVTAQRKEFPDARHHCRAFVIASEEGPARTHSSDDGEPSGTAGPPILNALLGADLVDVVCVVTRYFGGTLLGTGGLVRAYSDATEAAISQARITKAVVAIKKAELVVVTCPIAVAGRLEAEIRRGPWTLVEVTWGNDVEMEVALPSQDLPEFSALVAELSRDSPQIERLGAIRHEVAAGEEL